MSGLFGVSSGSLIGDYFTAKNTYSGTDTSLSVSDYSLIQSGSYKKLLTKYYAENDTTSTSKDSQKTGQDSTKELLLVKDGAATTKSAADSLTSMDLDKAKRSDVLKSAQSFVKEYNSLVESVGDLESVSVLQNGVWMTNQAKANKNALEKVGITIGTGNQLSIDETKFNKADISSLSGAFSGNNSSVGQLASRISQIQTLSAAQANVRAGGNAYTSSGSYQAVSTSKLYNSLF